MSEAGDAINTGDLITLAEAAERCELSYNTLRRLAWKGRLRATKMGNIWVTTLEAVEDYLASRSKYGRKPKSHQDDI